MLTAIGMFICTATVVNVLVLILQGTMSARFLRHEGFLGAVGAFLKVHPMTPPNQPASLGREPRKVGPCLSHSHALHHSASLRSNSCLCNCRAAASAGIWQLHALFTST